MTEFYINGKFDWTEFTSTILGFQTKLTRADVALTMDILSEGWSHYVKFTWILFTINLQL